MPPGLNRYRNSARNRRLLPEEEGQVHPTASRRLLGGRAIKTFPLSDNTGVLCQSQIEKMPKRTPANIPTPGSPHSKQKTPWRESNQDPFLERQHRSTLPVPNREAPKRAPPANTQGQVHPTASRRLLRSGAIKTFPLSDNTGVPCQSQIEKRQNGPPRQHPRPGSPHSKQKTPFQRRNQHPRTGPPKPRYPTVPKLKRRLYFFNRSAPMSAVTAAG
jgi:hypothetical protein